jgi:hypothetical protein
MAAVDPQTGLASAFSKAKFGERTAVNLNPVSATVGTTPTALLANNPDRLAWVIVNRDANPIGLAFSNVVNLTDQMILAGGGATMTMCVDDDGELVTFPVYAISAAGSAKVYVVEVERG